MSDASSSANNPPPSRSGPTSSTRRCAGCAAAVIPRVNSCPFCGTAWNGADAPSPSQRFPLVPPPGEAAPVEAGAEASPIDGQVVDQSEPLRCINCSTDVRGIALKGFCSGCGTPIINTFVSAGGIVNADLPCLNCGYVLRGLPASGRCPECAADVARSLHGNYLRYSSRAYVEGMRLGAVLVLASCVMKLVVNIGLMIADFVADIAIGAWGSGTGLETLGAILTAGCAALDLVGWWLISRADPAMTGNDPARSTRHWLMTMLITSAIVSVATLLATVMQLPFVHLLPGGAEVADAVVAGAWLIGWLIDGIRWFTAMRYLTYLSKRIPDTGLQSFSNTLMWLAFLKIICGLGDLALFILNIIIIARLRRALIDILGQIPERTT